MQLLILALFIGLFTHEAIVKSSGAQSVGGLGLAWGWLAVAVLAPKVLLAGVHHLACRRTIASIITGSGQAGLRSLERIASLCRNLIVASFLIDLFVIGALLSIRDMLGGQLKGNLILVDELIIIVPPLAATIWMWLSHYPVDVRIKHATFMARVQQGLPVQIWSRGQYILSQIRHQWALMGLPMLLLLAWWEAAPRIFDNKLSQNNIAAIMFAGGLVVFLLTPVMIRHVWDTVPLPKGDLRDRLVAMCRQYRVGIRELLLWRTYGGMINGAVMGAVAPLRYILLTDGLLETMPQKQVEAVMAHEVAHIRKHHVFWLLAIATAAMTLLQRFFDFTVGWMFDVLTSDIIASRLPQWLDQFLSQRNTPMYLAAALSLGGWFHVFGWVSRRFERQADTFAVQHLSRQWHAEKSNEVRAATKSAAGTSATAANADTAAVESPSATELAFDPTTYSLPALPETSRLIIALENGEPVSSSARSNAAMDPALIPPAAAEVMTGALQSVADLNAIPIQRNSWRHGSIAWRQDYLRGLAGKPIDAAPIDREVKRIKLAGFIVVLAVIAIHIWWP